jgi:hypothetical protein
VERPVPTLRLLPELEDALRQVTGVRAVSVVTGPDAQPLEVHVLATPGKAPKQVVRDVQSLALAQFDIDLDHRIVSVVQIGEVPAQGESQEAPSAAPESEAAARPVVAAISTRTGDGECEVEVRLLAGGDAFTGTALGPASAHQRPRVVAAATLAALKELLGMRCELESAQVLPVGTRDVALTVLALGVPRGGDQVLTGSAPVRGDQADAVARSVLDALNRTLTG